jgi:AraC-like DNA-binding protein/mannose-6-phosphate isomerase-like protein (cupin superfamily)
MKGNSSKTICQKYITSVTLHTYEFIIYYAEQLSSATVEFLHYHPYFEIYYVIDGTLNIFSHDTILHLRAGEILFLAPNIHHHALYNPTNHSNYFVIVFDLLPLTEKESQPQEYEQERLEIQHELDLIIEQNYIVKKNYFSGNKFLADIRDEMQRQYIGWNTIVNSLYFYFFIDAIRQIETSRSLAHEPPANLNLGLEASKYIHQNYQNNITLDSVAVYLNITPRHVNRVFYNLFGCTFSRTLNRLRVEYAKKYLCTTNYSIEKISAMVGFTSPRTLYKLFKEYEGVTISKYKDLRKQNPPENYNKDNIFLTTI